MNYRDYKIIDTNFNWNAQIKGVESLDIAHIGGAHDS